MTSTRATGALYNPHAYDDDSPAARRADVLGALHRIATGIAAYVIPDDRPTVTYAPNTGTPCSLTLCDDPATHRWDYPIRRHGGTVSVWTCAIHTADASDEA